MAEDYKIGTLNVIQVAKQSPQAELATKAIDREFSAREKKILNAQKGLAAMQEKLEKGRAIMSDSEIRKMERDIVAKQREITRSQDEFREDLAYRRNEELVKIQKVILDSIKEVADENKYDLVLSEGVIYAGTKVDMTKLVIDHLKKKYKKGGGSSQ
ncbi:MAG: OmpH/Skp family outer membrane protein [Candidatus Eutrophobiaceae bacterium]